MTTRANRAKESSAPPRRTWRESVEWSRKAIHVTSSLLAIWVLLVDEPLATGGLAIATLFVIAIDVSRLGAKRWALWIYRTFPLIFRRDERQTLSGASVMMAGSTITSYLFPAEVTAAGILCLAWGDSAAAVVGQAVSHTRQQLGLEKADPSLAPAVVIRRGKTWAGSTACLIASALVITLVIGWQPIPIIAGSIAAAAMERWTPGRWDNLTIPLVSAGIMQICLRWFG